MADRLAPLRAGLAGGSIAAVQSLGHGIIAFGVLGPEFAPAGMAAALLASAVASLLGALFAASMPLFLGTSSSLALTTAALLAAAQPPDLPAVLLLSMLLGLATALIMLVLAWAGSARLAGVLPTPVTHGIVGGVSLLIVMAQAPLALGHLPGEGLLAGPAVPGAIAVAGLSCLLSLLRLGSLPSALLALIGATALHLVLAAAGVATGPVIGQSPSPAVLLEALAAVPRAATALPPATDLLPLLIPAALSMAILATLELVTAAAILKEVTGRRAAVRRDLLAGAAGTAGAAILGGLACTAMPNSSVVAWHAGGRGRATVLVRVGLVVALLALAAPLLAHLPYAAIAGLLIATALRAVAWRDLVPVPGRGRRRRAADALVVALMVGTAAAFGLIAAIGAGMLAALLIFAGLMAGSTIRRAWRNPMGRSRIRRPVAIERRLAAEGDRVEVLELAGALFFGSAEQVVRHVERSLRAGTAIVVIDLARVTHVDVSGARRLMEAVRAAPGRVKLTPLDGHGRAAEDLEAAGALQGLPPDAAYRTFEEAVEAAEMALLAGLDGIDAEPGLTPQDALRGLGLPPAAVARLCALASETSHAPGETILRRGDPADDVYVLLAGEVTVSMTGPADVATRLAVLTPGVLFGETSLFRGGQRTADLTARGTVRCLRLSGAAIARLRRDDPEAGWALMVAVTRQLSESLARSSLSVSQAVR